MVYNFLTTSCILYIYTGMEGIRRSKLLAVRDRQIIANLQTVTMADKRNRTSIKRECKPFFDFRGGGGLCRIWLGYQFI